MGRVTRSRMVLRLGPELAARRSDTLAVEEPLEVRLNGDPFVVTMRTPGDDIDLVHGLLHSEAVIATSSDLVTARYCDGVGPDGLNTYNVLDVTLGSGVAPPDPGLRRNVLTTSACGVCGSTTIDTGMHGSHYRPGHEVRFPPEGISTA